MRKLVYWNHNKDLVQKKLEFYRRKGYITQYVERCIKREHQGDWWWEVKYLAYVLSKDHVEPECEYLPPEKEKEERKVRRSPIKEKILDYLQDNPLNKEAVPILAEMLNCTESNIHAHIKQLENKNLI